MTKKDTRKAGMRLLFVIAGLLTGSVAWAQDNTGSGTVTEPLSQASTVTGYSKDYVMLQFSYDGLAGNLPDSLTTKGFSRGFNLAFMYDFKLSTTDPNSNYSLGVGLGLSTSALFINQTAGIADSTTTLEFFGNSPYKKYKIATNYLEIPLELRYREFPADANKGFKIAAGLKLGILMNVHTKGKELVNGYYEIDKVYSKRFFNPYRADATLRVGLGTFSIFGAYSLTTLFKTNEGPSAYPFSLGICISGM